MQALPAETVTVDIHCVTRWSKLGTQWRGVSVDTLLDQASAETPYVLAFCDGGYTTNLPTEDVTGGKAWVAFGYDGAPLEPEHGGPARLWCRTCTSGRAPSGCAAWNYAMTTRPGSGRPTAITCMGTHGNNSGMLVINLADCRRHLHRPGDGLGSHHRVGAARIGPGIVPGSIWMCG